MSLDAVKNWYGTRSGRSLEFLSGCIATGMWMTRVDVGIVVPLELSRELLTCLVSEKNRFQCVCVQFCVCMRQCMSVQ